MHVHVNKSDRKKQRNHAEIRFYSCVCVFMLVCVHMKPDLSPTGYFRCIVVHIQCLYSRWIAR